MQLKLESLQAIDDLQGHSAFTDLIFFENQWWCGFRQASTHMSLDGKIVLYSSSDFRSWSKQVTIEWQGGDLRDPKFVITPEKRLLMLAGVRLSVPSDRLLSVASLNWLFDGEKFELLPLGSSSIGTWRWSATSFDQSLFSVGYSRLDIDGCLYRSDRGVEWSAVVKNFFPPSECFSNESSLVYDEPSKTAYCLLRRDGNDCPAVLGSSKPPFTRWQWQDMDLRIGGPKMLQLQNGELLAGFRIFTEDSAQTIIATLDLQSSQFKPLLTLPSDGDCSYPGMVVQGSTLFVSYYSSHQDSTSVYLAKILISF